jgi:hypothetical protein
MMAIVDSFQMPLVLSVFRSAVYVFQQTLAMVRSRHFIPAINAHPVSRFQN